MKLFALCVVGLAALLAGCGAPGGRTVSSPTDLRGEWRLREIGGQPIDRLLPIQDRVPTMEVDADGRVTGFAGVNRYSTSLDLDALESGRFEIGEIISTKMAGPGESMAVEARFLDLLSRIDRVGVSGNHLTMFEGDTEAMKMRRE